MRRPLRPRRPLIAVAALVAGAGCSSSDEASDRLDAIGARPATTEPWSEFCGGAVALVGYLDEHAASLFDPSTAAGFLAGAEGRLADLEGSAPEGIVAEVVALRAAYVELDRLLGEVGYDVARIDSESLLDQIDTEASLAFDRYLVSDCGFGATPEGNAPQILSEEELDRLLEAGP